MSRVIPLTRHSPLLIKEVHELLFPLKCGKVLDPHVVTLESIVLGGIVFLLEL